MTSSSDRTSLDPDVLRRSAAEIGELMNDMSSIGRLDAASLRPGAFPAADWFQSVLLTQQSGIVQHTNDLEATFGKIARNLEAVARDLETIDHENGAGVQQRLTEDVQTLNQTLADFEPAPGQETGPGGQSPQGFPGAEPTQLPWDARPAPQDPAVPFVSSAPGQGYSGILEPSTGGLQRPGVDPATGQPILMLSGGTSQPLLWQGRTELTKPVPGSPEYTGPGRTKAKQDPVPVTKTVASPEVPDVQQPPAQQPVEMTTSSPEPRPVHHVVTHPSGGGADGGAPSHAHSVSVGGGGAWSTVHPSGEVADWIREAIEELRANGVNVSDADAGLIATIIQHESGGDPNAINNYDSNAAAGHPSIGLMQTINTTFEAYKLPGHDVINNPVDNIIAGVRYAISRYGSLNHVPGIQGLAGGSGYVGY